MILIPLFVVAIWVSGLLSSGLSPSADTLVTTVDVELLNDNIKYTLKVTRSSASIYFLLMNSSTLEVEVHRWALLGLFNCCRIVCTCTLLLRSTLFPHIIARLVVFFFFNPYHNRLPFEHCYILTIVILISAGSGCWCFFFSLHIAPRRYHQHVQLISNVSM